MQLCGNQLLKHLDHSLDVLIVNMEFLLDVREVVPYPVVHIQKAGDTIEVQPSSRDEPSWSTEDIASPSGRYQPITIRTASLHEDDLVRARLVLEETFNHMDLVEPFGRITEALRLLAKEDQRFR